MYFDKKVLTESPATGMKGFFMDGFNGWLRTVDEEHGPNFYSGRRL